MHRACILTTFLALSTLAHAQASLDAQQAKSCQWVHARYEIYVERDSLWIPGSKHFLNVSNDLDKKLNEMLESKGWEDYALWGDFHICSAKPFQPTQLDGTSDIEIDIAKNLQFRKRY